MNRKECKQFDRDQLVDLIELLYEQIVTYEHLLSPTKSTAVILSDYFFALRNEIDIQAETLLYDLESRQDQVKSSDELSSVKINEMREQMLTELSSHETECFRCQYNMDAFDKAKTAELERLSKRTLYYKHSLNELLEQVKSAGESVTNNSKVNDQSYLEKLLERFKSFVNDIIFDDYFYRPFIQRQADLVGNKRYLFLKALSNPFGLLYIFEDETISEYEMNLISYILDHFTSWTEIDTFLKIYDLTRRQNWFNNSCHLKNLFYLKSHLILSNEDMEMASLKLHDDYASESEDVANHAINTRSIAPKQKNFFILNSATDRLEFVIGYNISNIRQLNERSLGKLANLKYLDMSNLDDVKVLPDDCFRSLVNLKYLVMPNISVEIIGSNTFSGLEQLKFLELKFNKISQLDAACFRYLRHLKKLDLSTNTIEMMSEHAFANLDSLELLDLRSNELRYLPNEAFKYLKNLQKLFLSNNRIEKFSGCLVFAQLHALQELDLRNNKLKKIDDYCFKDLSNLVTLNLEQNEICAINRRTFANLTSLVELNLSWNHIKSLDAPLEKEKETKRDDHADRHFNDLVSLKRLNLGYNRLSEINKNNEFFSNQNLSNLEYLILNNNHLTRIHKKSFHKLKSLKLLDVKSNNLKAQDQFYFENVVHIIQQKECLKPKDSRMKISLSKLSFENKRSTEKQDLFCIIL